MTLNANSQERIEKIKDTVRKLQQQGKHVIVKKWGWEYWVENNEKYCGKLLYLLPGFQSSLHSHSLKDETFCVLEGVVVLEYGDPYVPAWRKVDILKPWCHDSFRIEPMLPHRFWAIDGPAVVAEFSTCHDDKDVIRFEESRAI